MVRTFKPLAAYPTSHSASKNPMTLNCVSNSPSITTIPSLGYFFFAVFLAGVFTSLAFTSVSRAQAEIFFPSPSATASIFSRSAVDMRRTSTEFFGVSEIGFRPTIKLQNFAIQYLDELASIPYYIMDDPGALCNRKQNETPDALTSEASSVSSNCEVRNMTENNSTSAPIVSESGFSTPQNSHQNPQSQAVLTLFPVIDSQRPFLKAGEELWCVTLGGEVLRGPATRSECEAYAETWNRGMYASPAEVLAHIEATEREIEDIPEPQEFAVVMMRFPETLEWKPKGPQSIPPVENGNLKYCFARDITNDLNESLYRSRKGRVALVALSFAGERRYFVALTDTFVDGVTRAKSLQGVKAVGLTLEQARNEVAKINRLICETARYPKAWAVVAVDGSWANGVDVAVTVGEGVQS